MPFFSKVFKRDGATKSKNQPTNTPAAPIRPKWEESWTRKEIAAEEVQELIHACSQELKSRALDMPFLLLPFRPGSDPVGSKSFIRNYFRLQLEGSWRQNRSFFEQELKLMDPLVLVSIMKWCWSRLPGGVVTWETYDLFKQGETDSTMSKNAFSVLIPYATESDARKKIVVDFFDLLAAIAARGKTNGLGGRKLSRMAGWWAFEHSDHGKGFDGGYHSWAKAADATSHLFFAYLRSLAPEDAGGVSGISQLPRSLQALLSQTEYPPETPSLMLTTTPKVVMIVTSVSPTPFALLRRARNFEFRDDDEALQQFSAYDDPVQALTDECRRVINCVSNVNESVSPANGVQQEGAWSRFEDMGFSGLADNLQSPGDLATSRNQSNSLRTQPSSRTGDFGRPTTPSWADFLSTGFPEDHTPGLLPPEKSLPLPISDAPRGHSSQSHVRNGMQPEDMEAGELASINQFDLDETFWWVWMTSLASEETPERKSVFGRCALIETHIRGAHWLVIEEQIKGASPGQEEGVYLAEKKSRFSWTRRGRMSRKKTVKKGQPPRMQELGVDRDLAGTPSSRLAPDQHARVQEAAAKLKQESLAPSEAQKRARLDEASSMKTNSVLTLQPAILNEAGPAMKWTKEFDKVAIRKAYLGNPTAGRGDTPQGSTSAVNLSNTNGSSSPRLADRDLPALPKEQKSPIVRKPVKAQTPPATPPHQSDEALSPEPDSVAAFEKPEVEKPAEHPALRTQDSPESQRSAANTGLTRAATKKPKKDAAGSSSSGFRGLFGKKKEKDTPAPTPAPAPVTQARAQAPAPDPTPILAAPVKQQSSPHKLQKSPPKSVPIHIPYENSPSPEPIAREPTPPQSYEPQVSHPSADHYRDPSPERAITDREQRDADQEFSRFDQGPLDDVPAFVPESTPESSVANLSPPPQQTEFVKPQPLARERPVAPPSVPTPAESRPKRIPIPIRSPDHVSTPAPAAEESSSIPANDRWAQIRRNAAERAQRMNQQQEDSRRSHSQSGRTDKTDKTEDGDTSGEETIESRVARIKARVAELTGNMDTSNAQSVAARR